MTVPLPVPAPAASMHLLFWVFSRPPVNSNFCGARLLHGHICSCTPSEKLPAGTSMHLPFQLLISELPVVAGGCVAGGWVAGGWVAGGWVGVVPPPPLNGFRVIPAEVGAPSWTS